MLSVVCVQWSMDALVYLIVNGDGPIVRPMQTHFIFKGKYLMDRYVNKLINDSRRKRECKR